MFADVEGIQYAASGERGEEGTKEERMCRLVDEAGFCREEVKRQVLLGESRSYEVSGHIIAEPRHSSRQLSRSWASDRNPRATFRAGTYYSEPRPVVTDHLRSL